MADEVASIWRLIEVGRSAEARELLGRALASAPGDPRLHCLAAQIATAEGKGAEARQHLHQALSVDPDSPFPRFLWFALDVDEKRYAEAEKGITALIRERPDDEAFVTAYADLMLRTLHLDRAQALVAESLRLDPHSRDARRIAVLLATIDGKRDRAEHELAALIREDPGCVSVAATLFATLVEQGRHEEALGIAREMLRAQPGNTALVDAIVDLRMRTHPLAWPLRPLQRFGWGGAIAIWLGALLAINALAKTESPWVMAVGGAYFVFVVYSWVFPPLMRGWLRKRGA